MKLEFMAKHLVSNGILLLTDEDQASSYADDELIVANGTVHIQCEDTVKACQYDFFYKLEVSMLIRGLVQG